MSVKREFRKDNKKFKLIINDDMPEIFADGLSELIIGHTVSKLTLHTVTNIINEPNNILTQERKGVVMLTIPTAGLLEMCVNILEQGQTNIEKISEGGKANDILIRKIMEGVNISKYLTQ
ncbi:MAG: hypothetical protein ACU84H_10775 [Gammaproteobacteria bacterium]